LNFISSFKAISYTGNAIVREYSQRTSLFSAPGPDGLPSSFQIHIPGAFW
jgi:hypothetical protein